MNKITIGDLVRTRRTENHGSTCYRLYDSAQKQAQIIDDKIIYTKMVEKIFHDEVGLVLEVQYDIDKARVLSPRGIPGWISILNLELI